VAYEELVGSLRRSLMERRGERNRSKEPARLYKEKINRFKNYLRIKGMSDKWARCRKKESSGARQRGRKKNGGKGWGTTLMVGSKNPRSS